MKGCALRQGSHRYYGYLKGWICPDRWGSCGPAVIWGNPGELARGLGAGAYCLFLSTSSPQGRPATLLRAWSLLEKRILPCLLWVRYPLEQSHCSFQGEPTRSQGHPGSFRTCPVPEPKERGWRKSPDVVTRPCCSGETPAVQTGSLKDEPGCDYSSQVRQKQLHLAPLARQQVVPRGLLSLGPPGLEPLLGTRCCQPHLSRWGGWGATLSGVLGGG